MPSNSNVEVFPIKEDTYISSNKPLRNENEFPLLNVGQSEVGDINRALLKVDFGDLSSSDVLEAKLCLYQIFCNSGAQGTDMFYVYQLEDDWSQSRATWNNLDTSTIGKKVAQSSFPIEKDIEVCFNLDPKRITGGENSFIMMGDEQPNQASYNKHDRWFKAVEAIDSNHRPYVLMETMASSQSLSGGPYGSGSNSGGKPLGLILGLTTGLLALVALAFVGFIFLKRRFYGEEEEESSIESSESEKDFVDNLGEVFGVVSSSEEEDETMYTRDETAVTDDSSYISRWYRNRR